MRTTVQSVLLLVNVLLLGAGFYFFSRVGQPSADTGRRIQVEQADGGFRERLLQNRRRLQSNEASEPAPPPEPQVVYVTNQFHWSDVESADYREYIANLRSIGCPEPTIKDIIITDIMKLYAARRGQFYHNGREFKFWETDEKRKLKASQLAEREQQLAQIDKEIPAVLRELLGINYERELNRYFVETFEDDRRLSFVDESRRARLLALRDENEGRREAILEQAGDGALSDADREALRQIDEQHRESLARLLSPDELEEYELRTSDTANRLRSELIGFNPTEEEFRLVYSLKRALENSPSTETSQLEEELRHRLGDARFGEYQRAQNPDFRDAVVFSEIHELPPSTAASLMESKHIGEAESRNRMSNRAPPEGERQAALQAIREETEKSLRRMLGTTHFSRDADRSGRWIRSLGAPN